MRNLKKVLALVLALMMTLSLMVTASASDYTDDSSIEKTEAVEVMSMINVFQGTSGGNFDPEGNLTRAQAAKIISYMKLGAAVADVLPKDEAPFDDVKADRWYTGYVTYVKSEGIINGRSDKVFDPNGNVTGYEFGKMVLEAAGISGQYSGTSAWQLNVNLALRGKNPAGTNLMANVDAVLADPITREQACQMAFNALNYTDSGSATGKWIIKYADSYGSAAKVPADVKFDSFDAAVAAIKGVNPSATFSSSDAANNYTVEAEKDNAGSLARDVFGLTKATGTDKFGAPATVWTAGDDSVTVASAAAKSYEKTTGKTVKADMKMTGTINAVIVTDGKAASSAELTDATALGGNGATVDVYKVDDTNLKIIVVNTYVGTIKAGSYKAADEAKDQAEQVTISLGSVKPDTVTETEAVFETSKFTKDDEKATVLYTVKVTNATTIEIVSVDFPAEASGTVTRTSGTGASQTFVMGGETYKWSAKAASPGLAAANIGKDVTVYLDKAGNVIGVKAAEEAEPDYAVVVAWGEDSTGWNDESTYKVKLLLVDGSIVEKVVVTVGDNDITGDSDVSSLVGKICEYTDSDDGIDLTEVTGSSNLKTIGKGDQDNPGKIERNKPELTSGAVANKDTVFLITGTDGTVTVYTGISSVPSTQVAVKEDGSALVDGAADFQILVSDGTAKLVYVAKSQPVESTVDSSDVIFVVGAGARSADETGEYDEYAAVVNGEVTTLKAVKDTDLSATNGILFKAVKENTKGLVTEGTAMATADKALADAGAGKDGIKAPAGGNIVIESTTYVYGEDTKAYLYDGSEITEVKVEDITEDLSAKVYGYTDKDGVLAALFIVAGDTICQHSNTTWAEDNGDHVKTCDDCGATVDSHTPNVTTGYTDNSGTHTANCDQYSSCQLTVSHPADMQCSDTTANHSSTAGTKACKGNGDGGCNITEACNVDHTAQ